jgi:hypothetical protein
MCRKNIVLIHKCEKKIRDKEVDWRRMLLVWNNFFLSHLEALLFLTGESGSCSSIEFFSPSSKLCIR